MTQTPRSTILVLAYSISPVRGSEYAVGWNYVAHMSQDHDLVVLYGLAGDHMGDIGEMAGAEAQFGGRVTFVPVLPGRRARIANHLNRTGRVPFTFYVAYRYWHLSALAAARRIASQRNIDIVHYLCPIGFREPSYLWKLGKPYIWGPIGGIAPRPLGPFFELGFATGLKTLARNLVNGLQFRLSHRVRRGIREADVLLAATSENGAEIRRVYGREAPMVPENAIVAYAETDKPVSAVETPLQLIWVGTVEARKALNILLDALGGIDPARWRLQVLGSGPLLEASRAQADRLGISGSISWLGKVPREEALARFRSSDLHVLTSLAEAHSTVLWEAMSAGVPTIAIDHCGMHDSICDTCGIRVPLQSIEAMSLNFRDAIGRLIDDRDALRRLSAGALDCAERNSWTRRIAFWRETYDRAVRVHAERRRA